MEREREGEREGGGGGGGGGGLCVPTERTVSYVSICGL